MAVGQSALYGFDSYLTVGRETTYGTYTTATAQVDFLSSSMKTQQDSKILEVVETKRTYSKRIQLSKVIGGDISWYLAPEATSTAYILENAFGGAVTSATLTGETSGGGGFQHIFEVGNNDATYPSLCINARKGSSLAAQVFQYSGLRVNELTISSELDDAVMLSATFIGQDSTLLSNDVSSNITQTALEYLTFADGRISVETSFAALTTTSFWHVQSMEFKLNNNLKDGNEARRIGSDVLSVLPIGVQTYELNCSIRFDTSTAYDAMLANTEFGGEIEFAGATISGSVGRRSLLLEFQKLQIKDAGDPEISGPDGVLTANVIFDVLRDESATGYAVRGTLINTAATI